MQTSVPPLPTLSSTSLSDLLVDPGEALGGERRAGRAELPDAAEVELPAGLDALLAAGHHERRADAHQRRAGLLGQAPLLAQVRVQRVAVDGSRSAARQQRRHERVPHHPGGGGEPQQPVAGLQVPAQAEVLQVLDEDRRRGRGRSPWAARWCRTRTGRRAGGRTAPGRTRAAPGSDTSSSQPMAPGIEPSPAVGHVHHVLERRQLRRGSPRPRPGGRPASRRSV